MVSFHYVTLGQAATSVHGKVIINDKTPDPNFTYYMSASFGYPWYSFVWPKSQPFSMLEEVSVNITEWVAICLLWVGLLLANYCRPTMSNSHTACALQQYNLFLLVEAL